ncbi:MAG: HAMP domain-containing histidine kinase [Rhodospirillales bacterium]|nr:HAMP domain-containing histidine kinase [Rhodospirillales bacterium]
MAEERPHVRAERIRLLYRQAPYVYAANLVVAALVVAALWRAREPATLLGWAAAVLAHTLVRAVHYWRYRRRRPADAEMAAWGRWYTVGSGVSGVVWGSIAWLFVIPEDPQSLGLVAFVVAGMAAGALAGMSSHLPAFYAYLVLSVAPLTIVLLADGPVYMAMAGMGATFVVGLGLIAHGFHAALVSRIDLGERNRELLSSMEEKVRDRTAELEAANRRLSTEVAERERAQAGLEAARAEADRANAAKSRFLAAASHDLRQPLQSMFLFADVLRRRLTDQQACDALTMLERGMTVLKTLLDSLIDVARLDLDVIRPQRAAFELRPLLDDIAAAFAPVAAAKSLGLRVEIEPNLRVCSDPHLLGRMLRNLVENAVRYTERGEVVLRGRRCGESACVDVEDTGVGIPADQLERIFEEFHQVGRPPSQPAAAEAAAGLGLGLAIVQRLSTILDHPVRLTSEPGRGSRFTIEMQVE